MPKKEPSIFSFSHGFIPSFFFYLCLLIDLAIPVIFFTSEDFALIATELLGDSVGPILGFSSFFGILVFTFYGLVISLGFPTKPGKSALQLALRLLSFGLLYLLGDDLLSALFNYGLLEIISICAVFGLYFLAHYLFVKDKKQARKVFSYKGATIWVALFFGLPLLAIGTLLFLVGCDLFSGEITIFPILIWFGLFAPIFFAHFRTMQNYTVKYYAKY